MYVVYIHVQLDMELYKYSSECVLSDSMQLSLGFIFIRCYPRLDQLADPLYD